MSTLATVAVLTLVPLVALAATSFVKLSVVLSILRNALGTGQVPSGPVITVLALMLSVYIMAPVGEAMQEAASPHAAVIDFDDPLSSRNQAAWFAVVDAAKEPLRGFLQSNAGTREVEVFWSLAKRSRANVTRVPKQTDFLVLLPAFLFTELAEAFLIGFLMFLPFLVLDLLVAGFVLSLGLQTMPTSSIALPFKLLLFVAVDGWVVLAEALVLGYQ